MANKYDVRTVKEVCRDLGMNYDARRAFHNDVLNSIELDGTTGSMDYNDIRKLAVEWLSKNPSYDKHQQRGGGRTGGWDNIPSRRDMSRNLLDK